MPEPTGKVHALYRDFLERGVRYFFPDAELAPNSQAPDTEPALLISSRTDGTADLDWIGTRYRLSCPGRGLTEDQLRLLGAIGAVLSARYKSLFHTESAASQLRLFEGLPEDRYVSAFLDPMPYLGDDRFPDGPDVVTDAIEVMRESSLLTYENRRISTGVILLGSRTGLSASAAVRTPGAMPYTKSLVSIKSFHRLCDGLHTVFLVDREGMLKDLVDVRGFAGAPAWLPAPSSARYYAQSLATLRDGNICLILTPNGEIKVFAGGVQVFSFLEGRWRLTDVTEKYHTFHQAVGEPSLAERIFTAALNMAEHRRGGLFVVLNDPQSVQSLVEPADLLETDVPTSTNKGQVHYLLRGKRVLEIDLSVLQSVARVDGGMVMDRRGRLLAFGAILRTSSEHLMPQEGGRTTAAVHASRLGCALKISEDGLIEFFRGGEQIWEM
jgi:DNA integrity scanning protein DisA with diadenylate cyclase activity